MPHDRVGLFYRLMMLSLMLGAGPVAHAAYQTPAFPEAGRDAHDDSGWTKWSTSPELEEGRWAGGVGVGFLGGTPDNTALAANAHGDYFFSDNISMGPLLQFATTGSMLQFGLSNQWKYWIPIADTNDRGKMVLQGGVGFVHSDFRSGDTSWLIPLGVGYEHKLDSGMRLNGTALLNFTNLNPGRGSSTHVMPGLTFGVRF